MFKQTTLIAAILVAITLGTHSAFAGTPQQNSAVGFTDGCNDGKTNSANAFNGHSNASHHSQDYINGYNAGYNSCNNFNSVDLGQNANNVNQNNRNQPQTQGSSQSQGLCVTVFSGCSQTNGQSQGMSN